MRLVAPEPSPERARVLLSLAWHLVITARFAEARALAEEAAAVAAQVGARVQEADARAALGQAHAHAHAHLGEADAGIAELDNHRPPGRRGRRCAAMLRATVNHSDVLLAAGRLEETVRVALGGVQKARGTGLARYFGQILAAHATEHWSRQAAGTRPARSRGMA